MVIYLLSLFKVKDGGNAFKKQSIWKGERREEQSMQCQEELNPSPDQGMRRRPQGFGS